MSKGRTEITWFARGAARIANLVFGNEPISKYRALELFAERIPENKSKIDFSLKNYDFNDDETKILRVDRALELSRLSLALLQQT